MEGGKIRRRPSSAPPARPPHLSASAVLKIALPNPLHAGILFLNTSRETVSSSSKGEERTLRSFWELARLSVRFSSTTYTTTLKCRRASGHRYIGVSYAQLPFKLCLASSVAFWPTNRPTDHPSAIRPRVRCGSVSPDPPQTECKKSHSYESADDSPSKRPPRYQQRMFM